ncbi:hypothetical protein [Arcticibacterium luteifluviistationis]|uniref:Uncharacterized protein n=1 Tax=Arcticibacterium luteifluviistationis TaxID=1784714 RepID=A0A2Z4G861_9BACT|nr:hypothetical protein [Arcticibacterium luteifluviistationis]AWV97371.1 hypothetical protein DJ013_03965 [Arcticibacterium luteifluviistationis]
MPSKEFIEVTVKNHQILHGFNENNQEVIEKVEVAAAAKKLIKIDRILSISEKFILTSYAYDRIIYWEYEETYDDLKEMLSSK